MNTETKELLKLAAKAMGVYAAKLSTDGEFMVMMDAGWLYWNPLTSAHDLVEMECQLFIAISWSPLSVYATDINGELTSERFSDHPSRRAARAMASLRVVAELGRRMG
jgi:hypothetical protein